MARRPSPRTAGPLKSPVAELVDILHEAGLGAVHEYVKADWALSNAVQEAKIITASRNDATEPRLEILDGAVRVVLDDLRAERDKGRATRRVRAKTVRLEALAWCVRKGVDRVRAEETIADAVRVL
jgi:hypothetical protein